MELKQLYREIVNEHNLHPVHKKVIKSPDLVMRGVNPSCGDDITLSLKITDGVITDAGYEGSGCAISQASVDMMVDQILGKNKEEAIKLAGTFMGMIKGEITDEACQSKVRCAGVAYHAGDAGASGEGALK